MAICFLSLLSLIEHQGTKRWKHERNKKRKKENNTHLLKQNSLKTVEPAFSTDNSDQHLLATRADKEFFREKEHEMM